MRTLLRMRRFVILALVLTLKVAPSSEHIDDRSGDLYANDNTALLSSRDDDDMKQKCKKWAHDASPNFLQKILGWFGTTGVLAATYISTWSQVYAAMNYTKHCSDPKYGRIDKNLLLTKWNGFGNFIYPDTKWCGAGNVSNGTGDYGPANTTDKCCETHDNAKEYLEASAYNDTIKLQNPRRHTVTNCRDDMELYNCLYSDNTTVSLQFGQAFFDALEVPCFVWTYRKTCTKWSGWWFWASCLKYSLVTTGSKEWQFFYAPDFYKAFVEKWYSTDASAKKDNVEGRPDNWNVLCQDTGFNCTGYEFINVTSAT